MMSLSWQRPSQSHLDQIHQIDSFKSTLETCLLSALKHQSIQVLTYLLDEQGVDVNTIHPGCIGDYFGKRKPSIELLEILIARG